MTTGQTEDFAAPDLARLGTERSDPRNRHLDRMSTLQLAQVMNDADTTVPAAVGVALPSIVAAVDAIYARISRGGRLVYVGAGTSGRLATLDAAECPPTFGTDPNLVMAIMAGGTPALTGAVEGAEDDYAGGRVAVIDSGVSELDALVGISASGRTPFVLGALDEAAAAGALTVSVSCNAGAALSDRASFPIEVPVGPEVIAGSTRLKAGSAQKLVLNMISTMVMVKSGKTYGDLMVDVAATNQKLRARAVQLVQRITGVDPDTAAAALAGAQNHVKTAAVMILNDLPPTAARDMLDNADGRLVDLIGDRRTDADALGSAHSPGGVHSHRTGDT